MTEAEWLTSTNPQVMLAFLHGTATDRKLRLFAVACSRRVWGLLDDLGRGAVEVAEQYADGLADAAVLRTARLACRHAGGQALWYAAASDPVVAGRNAALAVESAFQTAPDRLAAERAAQADLLREIFGNLFRPVPVEPAWLTPEITALTRAIYDEPAFDRLAILADALQRAGCTDRDLLNHCRSGGVHVRGCWAADLLLARE